MTDCNFLQRAIALVQQATTEDRNKDYENALEHYQIALQYFMTALQYEKSETSKQVVRAKVQEYLARAEQLKEYLKKGRDDKKPIGATAGENASGEEEGGESKKFKAALEGAILREKPNVKWDDVAGLFKAKENLKEAVIMPLKFPHMFKTIRRPWKGILLYGPPGTGKSYLAKAVATEANSTFFAVSSSDLVSKWLGESEKLVRSLFEMARAAAPAIIFIDEIDSLCSARSDNESESARRIKTEFLIQMDGVAVGEQSRVLVLGATNLPWALDPAIRRRFEKKVFIGLPDIAARQRMFEIHTKKCPHALQPQQFRNLAESTEGYSGSDIAICVREAMMQPVRKVQDATHFKKVSAPYRNDRSRMRHDYMTPCSPGDPKAQEMSWTDIEDGELMLEPSVVYQDFRRAIRDVKPSVSDEDVVQHRDWTAQFGSEG
mmetsp:Transcript_20666/g.43699  ORF Transcript_20666/g.43699 Transcript_20666/m.43699 type:complete len:434 (+) Transcript_20666:11-1312(+)